MSQKIVFILLALLVVSVMSSNFACLINEWICKGYTCKNCLVASCFNGECECYFCYNRDRKY